MTVSLNIDTTNDYYQSQKFIIDNVPLTITTRWNLRANAWIISLYDIDNIPLVTGLKCMPNADLLARFRYMEILPGGLFCMDTNPVRVGDEGITQTNFGLGKRWEIVYFSVKDLQEGLASL